MWEKTGLAPGGAYGVSHVKFLFICFEQREKRETSGVRSYFL